MEGPLRGRRLRRNGTSLSRRPHSSFSRETAAPVAQPTTALRQLAGEALRAKDFFADRITELAVLRYQAGAGEQTRAELHLWERAIDRAQKFCLDLVKLNLDEREVAINQREAEILLAAALALMDHLGLQGEERDDAGKFLAAELRRPDLVRER